jgi:SAM-dependent methyltransferase
VAHRHANRYAEGELVTQPGYDALAHRYAEMFTGPYQTPIERHAVAAFVEKIGSPGVVVDVGCGIGHVTADLDRRGLDVIGCDPSPAMLAIARKRYPQLAFIDGDATLAGVTDPIAAIIARFSLIHLPPDEVSNVLRLWANRLLPGTPILIAAQSSDLPGPAASFDHAVAPAWRWHPDELSRVLADNGFVEEWRIVNRPDTAHRFPGVHLLAHRCTTEWNESP